MLRGGTGVSVVCVTSCLLMFCFQHGSFKPLRPLIYTKDKFHVKGECRHENRNTYLSLQQLNTLRGTSCYVSRDTIFSSYFLKAINLTSRCQRKKILS